MNFLKSLLPREANRIFHKGVNMDLSFITPRLLAMSFPSEGLLDSFYHNDIEVVSDYLKIKFQDHYKIYNLSGKEIKEGYFQPGSVKTYAWGDHHGPPLVDLFSICSEVLKYLREDEKNRVVINCLAGKGRTGTMYSCILLYIISNETLTVDEVKEYYSIKRFKEKGKGVNQPSQLQYIHYFRELLNTLPKEVNEGKRLGDLYNVLPIKITISFVNIDASKIRCKVNCNYYAEELNENCEMTYTVFGDFNIVFSHSFYYIEQKFGWIDLNTLFFKTEGVFLSINDINPYSLRNNSNFSDLIVMIKCEKIEEKLPQLESAEKRVKNDFMKIEKIIMNHSQEENGEEVIKCNANDIRDLIK